MIQVYLHQRVCEGTFAIAWKRGRRTERGYAPSLSRQFVDDVWGFAQLGCPKIIVYLDTPDCRFQEEGVRHCPFMRKLAQLYCLVQAHDEDENVEREKRG
jgi:hypothetical protein